ncbi:MAG: HAD-IA family hydrolase [Shewanella sp.]|nr:HAD-IA family hydrolase [Shewanella sp.]MCF1430582.1 HAD-IA family hydrolase [Shewanella sp.]MCF1439183.1 HAD-IA family hydrolase [Shewanella sp.]MCF1458481.1 HAD-IA family hydrolase [Shewanella sp.]
MAVIRQSDINLASVQGVVFDLDGTLASSNPDFDALCHELGIARGTDILQWHGGLSCLRQQSRASEIISRHELQSSATAEWIPGARELLVFLHHQGLPTAILTRTTRAAATLTLNRLQCDIELVMTRENAPAKPSPVGLQQICAQWGIVPCRCLYVGDYLFDLQAARNAGAMSLLYCDLTFLPEYARLADLVTDDYLDFVSLLRAEWPNSR